MLRQKSLVNESIKLTLVLDFSKLNNEMNKTDSLSNAKRKQMNTILL